MPSSKCPKIPTVVVTLPMPAMVPSKSKQMNLTRLTPTAELADYVLPVAHWLERDEVADASYMGCISTRQKVIEPIGECWDDVKIVTELVKWILWADKKTFPGRACGSSTTGRPSRFT